MQREDAINRLRGALPELRGLGVVALELFGSTARGVDPLTVRDVVENELGRLREAVVLALAARVAALPGA